MSSRMLRRCLTATMALAVGAAVVAFAPMSSAKGGPEKSRFAGTFDAFGLPVTISDAGHIAGSSGASNFYKVSISGRVGDDGSYSLTVTETYLEHGPRDHGRTKSSTVSSGTMALDADGNIVGTNATGGSFVWVRQ